MHENWSRASVVSYLRRNALRTLLVLGIAAGVLFVTPKNAVFAAEADEIQITVVEDDTGNDSSGDTQAGTQAEEPSGEPEQPVAPEPVTPEPVTPEPEISEPAQPEVTDPQVETPSGNEETSDDNTGSLQNDDNGSKEEAVTPENPNTEIEPEKPAEDTKQEETAPVEEVKESEDKVKSEETKTTETIKEESNPAPAETKPAETKSETVSNTQSQPASQATSSQGSMAKDTYDETVTETDTNGNTYSYDYRPIWKNPLTKVEQMRRKMKKVDKVMALANVKSYLNVRTGPDTSYQVIGTLNPNALVYIISDIPGEWVYVESGDVRGYVCGKYLLRGSKASAFIEAEGEENLELATEVIKPEDNTAFEDFLLTVYDIPAASSYLRVAKANSVIEYAKKFLGRPYVWGGTDLWNGSDCSGFMQTLFKTFGIELPRTAHEQSLFLDGVSEDEAKPGDLIFFADGSGHVYHVAMYIGDGKMLHSQNSGTGVVISDIDLSSVYKIGRVFDEDGEYTSTQAKDLVETGRRAYEGDAEAKAEIIEQLSVMADKAHDNYGFTKSVLMAQTILESGWLSFSGSSTGGIEAEDNNVLGMNEELLNDLWDSPWTGETVSRNVPQNVNGRDVYGYESMRSYEDVESCMEDYAAFKIGIHPELKGETDVDEVIDVGLEGYATDPTYKDKVRNIIDAYDLTQYDKEDVFYGQLTGDATSLTEEETELIWAIVAQEDDTSYEGALAVITAACNRANVNYGGYGMTVLDQLTADGQFCYSPKVSDPSLWERRLGGNVADFVKDAVKDAIYEGLRNHSFLNFRSKDAKGERTQIGSNWYF